MPDVSRQEKVDDTDRDSEAPEDTLAEPEKPSSSADSVDEVGCAIGCVASVLSLLAALLGGALVAAAHDLAIGVIAGIAGLVMGQVVAVALALSINSGATTDPEYRSLRDLPADKRVGSGLHTRRKETLAEAAREWVSIAIVFLAAPIATLLTSIVVIPWLVAFVGG